MSLRVEADYLSVEDDGLVEILHCSKLIVPSSEMDCKVAQGARSVRVPFRAKVERFSTEDNSFFKIPRRSKLIYNDCRDELPTTSM